MFGLSAAYEALKIAKIIPFRLLMMIIAALMVTTILDLGYRYVVNLERSLILVSLQLGEEKVARAEAETITKQIRDAHDQAMDRINTLEAARTQADADANDLRIKLQNVPTTQDMTHDPKKTASDFASRSRELNRLLEHATKIPANRSAVPRAP